LTTVHRIEVPIPFPLRFVNSYYIADSVPTLIDAGVNTEQAFEAIRSAIETFGGSLGDIQRIVVTHAHSDHLGLAARIAELTGAMVFIHMRERDNILPILNLEPEVQADRFRAYFLDAGVPTDVAERAVAALLSRVRKFFRWPRREQALNGGEQFRFDDFTLEVIHTPGHTPGSVCLLNRANGTFFAGDSLLEAITPNPVASIQAPEERAGYRSLAAYLASLEIIKDLPIRTVLPGHGSPFGNHARRVQEIKAHHLERRAVVLRIIQDHHSTHGREAGLTRFLVAQGLFPALTDIEFFLGLSEAQGHLEILEDQGIVRSYRKSGRRLYRLC